MCLFLLKKHVRKKISVLKICTRAKYIDTLIHRECLRIRNAAESACGIADAYSDARVAKNGDPRLKTEQLQGMQRIAAHLAAGELTASPTLARTYDSIIT